MELPSLQQLDQRRVAVVWNLGERPSRIVGQGAYGEDPELGPVLRITVADPTGDFEFLLQESRWDGKVEVSPELECDFLVRLGPACTK